MPPMSLNASEANVCNEGSGPIKMWAAEVLVNRWATAAGELRGEIGNAVYPALNMPAARVKYVMVSARHFQRGYEQTRLDHLPLPAKIANTGLGGRLYFRASSRAM